MKNIFNIWYLYSHALLIMIITSEHIWIWSENEIQKKMRASWVSPKKKNLLIVSHVYNNKILYKYMWCICVCLYDNFWNDNFYIKIKKIALRSRIISLRYTWRYEIIMMPTLMLQRASICPTCLSSSNSGRQNNPWAVD